ncbi:MAG: hypothetical protein GX327_06115 [Epulopiscium sp.]|nr:hypothetical protein [Candidatus Epulonipiscium sp.]
MNFKKAFSLLLVLTMTISFLSGCSSEEIALYNLAKEANSLERYVAMGEVECSIDYEDALLDEFISFLDKYSFLYEIKIDINNSLVDGSYYIKDKKDNKVTPIVTLKSNGETIYVKIDDLLNFVNTIAGDESYENPFESFGDVKYISFSRDDFVEILSASYGNYELAEQMASVYFDMKSYKVKNQAGMDIIGDTVFEVYKDYEMGIVKENGNNKYSLSVNAEETVAVIASLINYTIDNIEKIEAYSKASLSVLSESEKQALITNGITVNDLMNGINEMVTDISSNKEEYKKEINDSLDLTKEEVKRLFGNSKIDYSFEKTSDNKYVGNLNVLVEYKDPDTNKNLFKATLSIKNGYYAIDAFSVEAPTENVISIKELTEDIYGTNYPQYNFNQGVMIDLDTGYTVSGFGENVVDVKVIDGSSYLPLRAVGELLGEDIKWDNQRKQPYVNAYENAFIYLDAKIIEDTSFVKLREIEKIGYTVTWDPDTNMVSIDY